jgi:type 2A phosphatase activator TIP41
MPLTDPMFIANVLTNLPSRTSQEEGASTRWRGLGTKTEIILLDWDQAISGPEGAPMIS